MQVNHNQDETFSQLVNDLWENISEYAFMTTGDAGIKSMAGCAAALSIAMFDKCGIDMSKVANQYSHMCSTYEEITKERKSEHE